MSQGNGRTPVLPASLGVLRWRLTAWYVGTFFAILLLLGIGMFATMTRRFDRDLDESLRASTAEFIRVVRARSLASNGRVAPMGAMTDLRIPERELVLLDSTGARIGGGGVPVWLRDLARNATRGSRSGEIEIGERNLRAYAEPFAVPSHGALVAIALADEIELENRYASLIAAFGASAFIGLILVAGGGWLLARKTTEPVERAITYMRRFMADAAHELRTPLTIVRSRAEVALQRSRPPEEYSAALHAIERESARLGHIVEDLLMLARADAGERPIERRRVFLDDVGLDALDAARVIAARRNVRLEMGAFEEAPVDGDASLLRQLTMIFLDNAIKFTEPGGVVRLGIRRNEKSAILSVEDNGIGIPNDQLPHVFERFYRGDPARTRDGARDGGSEGAGLGLSIARWIADEHGAAVHIDSTLGSGTRVNVEFPPPTVSLRSAVSSSSPS